MRPTCYAGRVKRRLGFLVCALALVAGCKSTPTEQRTSHGPSAEELFFLQSVLTNRREPSFRGRSMCSTTWFQSHYLQGRCS